ncbi:hypothetical protein ECH_1015 [Ehrlichia chaffeensis str. Arkansas]|uniref:Uncharacterized protein n=1 Tax=Ehrlichia chaffeensis (strain ATCC CRL-10679 / Arkansas) TaxID=205920 RepID=Q2GFI2_EHRCR|nr:hypothetical protein ECH_1015 [Ehrlichia chaffeensis str. Arkansas]
MYTKIPYCLTNPIITYKNIPHTDTLKEDSTDKTVFLRIYHNN